MGTKVQCKSYMPGYNPMRGHDDDRNGSWSVFYDGSRAPNGHLYNAFMLKPMNGYSEYDKEMLKRTMLEHEAVFRKQVYELHRLYRIQKNLMDELKRKELYRYSVQLDTSCSSQANSFCSQIQLEDSKRMLHTVHLPVGNSAYSRAPATAMDNLRFPVNFLKDNQNGVQSGHSSVENGYPQKEGVPLESISDKAVRKMFDLQLPADVYIDDEETERSEKESAMKSSIKAVDFLNKSHSKEPEDQVLLTLGTKAQSNRREDNHRLDPHLRNGFIACSFADLNEPIKGSSSEVSAYSSASYLFGPKTHNVDFLESKLPLRANSNLVSLQKGYDRHKDAGVSLNFTCNADMLDTRKELPLFRTGQIHDHIDAFGPSLYNEKSAVSSQKIELKLNRTNGIKESNLNKMDTWFRQKLPDNIELSGANSHLAGLNKSRIQEPSVPNIMLVVPSDLTSTLSPLDSASRKSMNSAYRIPFAIQALPHFDTSATVNSENWISNTQNKSSCGTGAHQNSPLDLSFTSHFDHTPAISEKTKHISNNNCNGAAIGSSGHSPQKSLKGLHCRDVKSVKALNLNEAFTIGFQDNVAAVGDSLTADMKSKHEESSVALSWLKRKPSFEGTMAKNSKMELCSMQSYSQLLSSFTASPSEFEKKPDKDKVVFAPSTLDAEKKSGMCRNNVSDNLSSKRILGFPIIENIQKTTAHAHQSQSFTGDTKCNKGEGLHHLENQSAVCGENGSGTNNVSSRNHINLNFSACAESPKSSDLPSGCPVPVPKATLEIDLEAPPICQPEDDTIFPGESLEVKQHSLSGYCSKEMENLHERCLREAAESIVAISLDACSNGNEGTCRESSPAGSDALYLLAEVVLSNSEEELKERSSRHANALCGSGDGLDLFELMTLNLKEMKEDEYWCQSQEPVNQKEEENGAGSLLLTTKPRRGQARKRRQKRDFQKDILPGLASLARHEVTEDLQVIGGLMRASGRSWQVGLTRRNNGRNATQTQAKGRQQPRRQQHETVPEIVVSHQAKVDPKAIIVWGRTTRRCRRPRCPLGNGVMHPPP